MVYHNRLLIYSLEPEEDPDQSPLKLIALRYLLVPHLYKFFETLKAWFNYNKLIATELQKKEDVQLLGRRRRFSPPKKRRGDLDKKKKIFIFSSSDDEEYDYYSEEISF